MTTIEIEFASLEEARASGPEALLSQCVRDGLRPLGQAQFCGRDDKGIASLLVAEPPVFVVNISGFTSDPEKIKAGLAAEIDRMKNKPAASADEVENKP